MMEKLLYPTHPHRCFIGGPGECGKSVLLTNLVFNISNKYDKIYFYSQSSHQDLYQKTIKCFSKNIPIHIIPKILNGKDIDLVIEEVFTDKDFQNSDSEIETNESNEELKLPQNMMMGVLFS